MRPWQQRLAALCGVGLFLWLIIHQGTKKTPFGERMYKRYTQPFVDTDAYGVVTRVRKTDSDMENVVYWTKGNQEVYYFDLKENWEKRCYIGRGIPVRIGDSIRKSKGEKRYSLTRQNGERVLYTIP